MKGPECLLGQSLEGRWTLEKLLGTGPRSWAFGCGNVVVKLRRPRDPGVLAAMLNLRRVRESWNEVGLVQGGPLAGCIYTVEPEGRPLPQDIKAAGPLLAALGQLHQRGELHGALGPNNLLEVEGGYYLSDSGMADLDDRLRVVRPREGRTLKPEYEVAALLQTLGISAQAQTWEQALARLEGCNPPGIQMAPGSGSCRLELPASGPLAFAGGTLLVGGQAFHLADGRAAGKVGAERWSLLCLSGDQSRLAGLTYSGVVIYHLSSGRRVSVVAPGERITAIELSHDGQLLRTLNSDGELKVWQVNDASLRSSQQLGEGGWDPIFRGRRVAAGDGQIYRVWDGDQIVHATEASSLACAALNPAGDCLALGDLMGQVLLSQVVSRDRLAELEAAHEQERDELEMSLLECHKRHDWEAANQIQERLQRSESGLMLPSRSLGKHARAVTSLAFSPDGRSLASASEDGSVRLWRIPEGDVLGELPGMRARQLLFSPDGSVLALGRDDSTLVIPLDLLPLKTWLAGLRVTPTTVEPPPFLGGEVRGPEGLSASIEPDSTVRVFDPCGHCIQEFQLEECAFQLAWVDSRQLVAALPSMVVRLNLNGQSEAYVSDCSYLAASPTGMLAWICWGHVQLWEEGAPRREELYLEEGEHAKLAFSPDGAWLAAATQRCIVFWDPATGRELARFEECGAEALEWLAAGLLAASSGHQVTYLAVEPL